MVEPILKKVHEDSRGEMYSISLPGDRELMLLHSKEGSLRGGHCHDVPETVLVLLGKMRYYKHPNGFHQAAVLKDMGPGFAEFHQAGVIHMGEFLEDSWIVEMKDCKDKHSWKNIDYEPWREKVRANAGA